MLNLNVFVESDLISKINEVKKKYGFRNQSEAVNQILKDFEI